MEPIQGQFGLHSKSFQGILSFLKIFLELFCQIYDIIYSIPAKPLLKSTLKCGGFSLLWGTR